MRHPDPARSIGNGTASGRTGVPRFQSSVLTCWPLVIEPSGSGTASAEPRPDGRVVVARMRQARPRTANGPPLAHRSDSLRGPVPAERCPEASPGRFGRTPWADPCRPAVSHDTCWTPATRLMYALNAEREFSRRRGRNRTLTRGLGGSRRARATSTTWREDERTDPGDAPRDKLADAPPLHPRRDACHHGHPLRQRPRAAHPLYQRRHVLDPIWDSLDWAGIAPLRRRQE